MVQKTREQLEKDIKALVDAGLDASEEKAQLKQLVLAGAAARAPAKAKAKAAVPVATLAPAPEPVEEEDFVPLNTESYATGGGGWTAPETIGVKDAVCTGYMVPDFVEDQLWFLFQNPEYPSGGEPFRGALVCGAISKAPGTGGAWKVRDVAIALGVDSEVEIVEGEGIKGLRACEGKSCQVLWDDIVIKGKTERRIQDVMAPGAEATM